MINDEQRAVTPGGRRPAARTHLVRAGETVREDVAAKPVIVEHRPADHVLTPGGYRPGAKVRRIDQGQRLDATQGRLRKLTQSGRVVADFGEFAAAGRRRGQSRPRHLAWRLGPRARRGLDRLQLVDQHERCPDHGVPHDVGRPARARHHERADHLPVQRAGGHAGHDDPAARPAVGRLSCRRWPALVDRQLGRVLQR